MSEQLPRSRKEGEELCVCDFVGALGLSQSKASRHLRYLYHAGLVKDRREGLWMHYRLSPALSPEQAIVVAALSEAISEERRQELSRSLESWFAAKKSNEVTGKRGTKSRC